MKTAVSLPDQLFEAADRYAAHLHVSRSQFYATALESFIAKLEKTSLTERINAFIDAYGQDKDEALERHIIAQMKKVEW